MTELYLGLMSGTSVDAVDGALVDFSRQQPQVLGFASRAIGDGLRGELLALQQRGANELERSALARRALTLLYAQVAGDLYRPEVAAIGAHGQTVRHRPESGYTIQLIDGALLAELSGATVICDFRSADVAAGGQGAPLVPAFHAAAFSHPARRRVILNIGGIANVSLLASGEPVRGHDCGPGNVLIDEWCARHTGQAYDAQGQWAAGAAVDTTLLEALLDEPYFVLPAPKSTGRDLFNLRWLDRILSRGFERLAPQCVQSTLLQLTVESIAASCKAFGAEQVFGCGGGVRNAELMRRLRLALDPAAGHGAGRNSGERTGRNPDQVPGKASGDGSYEVLASTAVLGVDPQAVEAVAFAWLAARRLAGLPGNLPAVTGARGERLLGAVYAAPERSGERRKVLRP
ncbi:MAG: anhydro-N-acetylmuramic acid kinase [Burkholderiaceae bacterium]|nr:anhydro-N-acetylmuramic acid kinase [Burkholderiaceae bacterium]